jgi:hypothetical protein
VFSDVLAAGAVEEEEVLGPATAGCSFSFLARCSSSSYYIISSYHIISYFITLHHIILYHIIFYYIIHIIIIIKPTLTHPPTHTHTHIPGLAVAWR